MSIVCYTQKSPTPNRCLAIWRKRTYRLPPHRQAPKRWAPLLEIDAPNKEILKTNIFHFENRKLDVDLQNPKHTADIHSRIR